MVNLLTQSSNQKYRQFSHHRHTNPPHPTLSNLLLSLIHLKMNYGVDNGAYNVNRMTTVRVHLAESTKTSHRRSKEQTLSRNGCGKEQISKETGERRASYSFRRVMRRSFRKVAYNFGTGFGWGRNFGLRI